MSFLFNGFRVGSSGGAADPPGFILKKNGVTCKACKCYKSLQ